MATTALPRSTCVTAAFMALFVLSGVFIGLAKAATLPDADQTTIDEEIAAAAAASADGSTAQIAASGSDDVVKVELDILYSRKEFESLYGPAAEGSEEATSASHWKVMIDGKLRWPDAVMPYLFNTTFTDAELQNFDRAVADYYAYTCLRLRPAAPHDRDLMVIRDGDGCSSYVGRRGGPQAVTLARGCRTKGIIIHEIAHAAGFLHEQTRPDRDGHVLIAAENIQEGKEHNFRMRGYDEAATLGVAYDYLSVMHYGERSFSKNQEATIIAKDAKYQKLMGNRRGFTFNDLKLINLVYGCAERSHCPKMACPDGGFVGGNCRCWCDSGNLDLPVVQCEDTNQVCERNGNSYAPLPGTQCEAFQQWAAGVPAATHRCPIGLRFDTSVCACNWKEQVSCSAA